MRKIYTKEKKMNLDKLLMKAVEYRASDLHICVGVPPAVRSSGELVFLSEDVLDPEVTHDLLSQCMTKEMHKDLMDIGEIDFAYSIQNVARFRVNIFKQRNTLAAAFRTIPTDVPRLVDLGLPRIVKELAEKRTGLILVTGPTGSGKSTTLAAVVDYINENKKTHIISVEDPIEYLHRHKKSIVNQRELGIDTKSFANALRASLREDPDVILIGEMRDQETISVALTAAETGHLVLSTLHTVGAAKTVDRIIDVFPPFQQGQVRVQLSTVLKGIVSQQLVRKKDGLGRCLATEVMILTPAIANLIREARTPQINSSIHTGLEYGMHSMDSCLSNLFKDNKIDFQTACQHAVDVENLRKLVSV
jgi:twitching motility protein PilT